jgi:hypothetical protein
VRRVAHAAAPGAATEANLLRNILRAPAAAQAIGARRDEELMAVGLRRSTSGR